MPTSEIKNWVLNLAGRKVSMAAPAAGQFLKWNSATSSWEPQDLGTFTSSIISDFASAVDNRISLQKGQPNGLAQLGPDGKIPSSQIPALAITRVEVVSSQAAQLALAGMEAGDVVIRTDLSKTFIHNGGTTGTMADYTELLAPPPPVLSVNGQTGAVMLTSDHIAEGTSNLYFTPARVQNTGVGGDLSGTVGNASVVRLRGIAIAPQAPSSGQVLIYNSATQQWEPGTPTALPAPHTHSIADIIGLQQELDGKVSQETFDDEISKTARFASYEITFDDDAFKAAASSVDIVLATLPANAKLTGLTLRHEAAFAGGPVSAVSVSIGAKVGSVVDPEFYSIPFDVSQTPGPTVFHDVALFLSKTSASHQVVARFTANANFGTGSATNLTAGRLIVSFGHVVLPAGPQ